MALRYSGGPYINQLNTSITTRQGLLNTLNTNLLNLGFSSSNIFAFTEWQWTGQPADTQTATVGGEVYTFRTTINNSIAREVLIGADANATALNFYQAINAGAGAGTQYSTATVANAVARARDYRTANGKFRVEAKTNATPFGLQDTISFSETCTNCSWTWSTNRNAGYIWTSPLTSQRQQYRIYGIDALESNFSNPCIRLCVMTADEQYRGFNNFPENSFPGANDRGFQLYPNLYTSWRTAGSFAALSIVAEGSNYPYNPQFQNSGCFFGVPYLWTFSLPLFVNNVTAGATTTIETISPHGFTTGTSVFCGGIIGITGTTPGTSPTGIFTITVTGPNTFTIPVSTTGTWVSGTGVAAAQTNGNPAQVCYAGGFYSGGGTGTAWPGSTLTMSGQQSWQTVNGNSLYNFGTANIGYGSIGVPAKARMTDNNAAFQFYNNDIFISEPYFFMGTAAASNAKCVGQMLDCSVLMASNTYAQTTNFDSRNWYNITNGNAGSSTSSVGSLFIVVP